jgi:hypothetical protein
VGANEVPVSVASVISARPTIAVDGAEVERLTLGLLHMVVNESIEGLASLEVRLSNFASNERGAGLAFDAGSEVALGAGITVDAGPLGAQRIFDGRISALEAVAGETRTSGARRTGGETSCRRARLARRTRVYSDMSLDDLARQIGQNLGLTVDTRDLPRVTATFAQFNESDLAFLRRVLARRLHAADRRPIAAGVIAAGKRRHDRSRAWQPAQACMSQPTSRISAPKSLHRAGTQGRAPRSQRARPEPSSAPDAASPAQTCSAARSANGSNTLGRWPASIPPKPTH